MSISVNKVNLIGYVGDKPQYRENPNGYKILQVSLATNETYKKDNKKQEITQWHNVAFYGKYAEIAYKYIKKGDLLYVEGQIKYAVKASGEKTIKYTNIAALSFQILKSKNSEDNGNYKENNKNYYSSNNNDESQNKMNNNQNDLYEFDDTMDDVPF